LSDADDYAIKGADNEVIIANTATSVKRISHEKCNAEGILSLQKNRGHLPAAYHLN